MKTLSLLALLLAAWSGTLMASEGALRLAGFATDRRAIVEGARLYAQRCLPCHTMRYLRYSRLPQDLGLDRQAITTLMLPDKASFDHGMQNTLDPALAAKWFGVAPPDLTLEARLRGGPWITAYLHGFYLDPSRPGGWNNHLFPNVGMPNVLAELSGARNAQGQVVMPGSMSTEEYDRTVAALRAWLEYASDPSLVERRRVGPWVITVAAVLAVLLWLLHRSYWREVERPER